MKLPIIETKKGEGKVVCPRIQEEVDAYHICRHCDWLAIIDEGCVKCRWTKEKEQIKTGQRYYETI